MSNNNMNMNMNMNSSEEEEEEEEADAEEQFKFQCEVCQRKFKSGKALGGHKRMHNISSSNNKKTKTSTVVNHNNKNNNNGTGVSEENSSDSSDEDSVELCCRLCQKSFPSHKSLFGHMRSHPERGWRGIDPPPEDEQQDALPPPPPPLDLSWSKTGRRGGACPRGSSSEAVSVLGMDQDSANCVINLILLKSAKTENPIVTKEEEEEEEEEEESRSKKKKKTTTTTTTSKKDYICSVCKKSFTSYQALGGHMSSHNKLPHNNDNSNNNNNKVVVVIDLNQLAPADHSS